MGVSPETTPCYQGGLELSSWGTLGLLRSLREVAKYSVDNGVEGNSADLSVLHSPCLWRTWLSQRSCPTWVLEWQPLSWDGNGQDGKFWKPTPSGRRPSCVKHDSSWLDAKWDERLCAGFSNNTGTVLQRYDLSRCGTRFLSELWCLFCRLLLFILLCVLWEGSRKTPFVFSWRK